MSSAIDLHWVQQPGTALGKLMRPATVHQALTLLAENPELRPVAGGTDLVLDLARSGNGGEVDLLDLTHVDGLAALDFADDAVISIGAAVTHADILRSRTAAEQILPLAQACLEVGSPQLRNRATVVGNVVTASPANDTISALLALDATVVIAALDGDSVVERQVKLEDFYVGFRTTVLQPGELVTRLVLPQPPATRRGIWVKAGLRKAQAISVVHAGLVLDIDDQNTVTAARIALGSVGPTVALSEPAAQILVGAELNPDTIAAAAEAAAASVTPIDDGRATASYRSASVRTVVSRALAAVLAGAEGGRWPDRVPLLSVVAHGADLAVSAPVEVSDVTATVNSQSYTHTPGGTGTLLDWLRETAGTGTKEGCAEGECGACTVRLDGDAVMSCLVPATQAHGAQVQTIEGLSPDGGVHPMQQAFVDHFAVQCGYCIPGFVMAAQQLAEEFDTTPTRDEVELALSGNLCRCTGYYSIIDAVIAAIESGRS